MINLLSKKVILTAAAVGLAYIASAQPKPIFLETKHNFGTFNEDDGLATCRFAIVNEGTSPLSILAARATCGCTTPQYSRDPVAPGDTTYITVSYDPKGRPGRFNKPVYVETNGTQSKTRLDISGVVIGNNATLQHRYPVDFGPLKLSRDTYALGEATMDHIRTIYLEGYNQSSDSLHVKVENVPSYLDIVVAPEIAPPGEQVTFIAYVTPHKGAEYGVLEDTIRVIPAPGLSFDLPTILTVKEDFSGIDASKMANAPIAVPSTDRIELGRVAKDGDPITTSMKIENAGKDDLKIRRVYSVDPGVTAKAVSTTVKKGKSTTINITIDPDRQTGSMLNTRLHIITNDPLHPLYVIRIVGEWDNR